MYFLHFFLAEMVAGCMSAMVVLCLPTVPLTTTVPMREGVPWFTCSKALCQASQPSLAVHLQQYLCGYLVTNHIHYSNTLSYI